MPAIGPNQPGRREAHLSLAFMAILVIVGLGVVRQQYRFNPAVLALRPEAHQSILSQEAAQPALIETEGAGIIPFSPPERFGPDTLYEKINGRADLYLSSGFVSLATQRFSLDGTPDSWVEVFVYDMATPQNAFAVFSMQRREDAAGDAIAPQAYRTANALFLVHANAYLEFIGTDDSANLHRLMSDLAQTFMAAHGGVTATQAPGADLFPEMHAEPESLQLITANAFGYAQLDQVYTRAYTFDGSRLTAFVSRRSEAAAAKQLADVFVETLLSYGAERVEAEMPIDGAVVLRFFDTYDIVFSRGPFLAGIHEAGNLESASALTRQLAAHLEQIEE